MSITANYDPEARAMYVRLQAGPVASSVEIDDDLVIDMAADGTPVGLELLDVPAARQQISGLAVRFGFPDALDEVLAAIRGAQPAQPRRTGVLIASMREFSPAGAGPLVVGASSAAITVESHEYALSG